MHTFGEYILCAYVNNVTEDDEWKRMNYCNKNNAMSLMVNKMLTRTAASEKHDSARVTNRPRLYMSKLFLKRLESLVGKFSPAYAESGIRLFSHRKSLTQAL